MKCFILIPIAILLGLSSKSQLTGIKSIPGDYADLAGAIADLNSQGPGIGGVTFNVMASQLAPVGGYTITATGTSSNPVTFQGNGNSISATGSNANVDGIFKLAGCDYTTINNFVLNGDQSVEWGIALLKKNNTAPYDGCNHNNLTNLVITLDKTNTRSVGIYAAHHTTQSTDLLSTTFDPDETNSSNSANGNIISNAYTGISFSGFPGNNDGLNYLGNTNGNQILDYGGDVMPAYGIYMENCIASEIKNNLITLSDGNLADVYGIDVASDWGDITIADNTIRMSGNIHNSKLTAINCGSGDLRVQLYNNHITDCNISALSGTFIGISLKSASSNNSIQGNIVNNNTYSGTGTMNLIDAAYCYLLTVSGNSVYDNIKSGASGSLFCIRVNSSGFGGKYVLDNNFIYSNSIISNSGTDSSRLYGIYDSLPIGSTIIINNQIHDLSINGSATPVVSYLCGIHALNVDSIADNLVYNLEFNNSSGGSGIIKGIVFSGLAMRNRISQLNAISGPGSLVYGIESGNGTILNNMIGNLHARASENNNAVCGINFTGSAALNIYYNTILLNDTSSGNGFGSSAISASIASDVTLLSNILINKSLPGTAGYTVVYRRSSPLLTTYVNSGYNLLYAGNPGPRNLIYYDGSNADQTLAAFKNRVTPNDSKSVTENTTFQSTEISSSPYSSFLRVSYTIPSLVESGGPVGSGLARDIDGELRQGSPRYRGTGYATDIGADEFEGRTLDLIDIGATSLQSPVNESCHIGYPDQVVIDVTNYGLNDVDFIIRPVTIKVQVTGAKSEAFTTTINYGSLASGTTQSYVVGYLDMSAPGVYHFNAYTTLAGDTISSNNAMPETTRIVRPYADLPDSIDFNIYDGNNLATLFPEWYEASGETAPVNPTSLWENQAGLGGPGNISAKVNLHSSGHNEWIVGPKFWATQSAELKFDIAITAKDDISTPAVMGSDDVISVMVSNDCGGNWYPIRQFTVNDAISSTFETKTISLNQGGMGIWMIAIKASDGTIADPQDYDIHIDNIVLKCPFTDFGVVSLVSPVPGCHSNAEKVSVAIKNFDNGPAVMFPIFPVLTVLVTGPVTTTLTRQLDNWTFSAGQTINFDMPGYLDMSLPGVYKFNVSLSVPSDPDNSNNTLQEISHTVWSSGVLPLQVDFAGYDGANLTSASPGWSEGAGANAPSGGQSSWMNCINLNTVGNVSARVHLSGNTANEWIISPYFVPTEAIELKLKVAVTEHGSLSNSAIMGMDDKVGVLISTDCGQSWKTLRDFTAADALTPALTEFTIHSSSYAGKKVLIAIHASDGLVDEATDYDFHIDDLQLQAGDFPVPVELLSFSGQRAGNVNLLKWSTASEQNVKGFQIERSLDAISFTSIGFLNSKAAGGNSQVQLDYEYADNNLAGDRQYYRLRQFDIDGRSHLSNVIVIRTGNYGSKLLVGLYPNPANNKLLIEIQAPYREKVRIIAVNGTGQTVKEQTTVVEKGVNTIGFDVYDLVPGIYILRVVSPQTGEETSQKFGKQ